LPARSVYHETAQISGRQEYAVQREDGSAEPTALPSNHGAAPWKETVMCLKPQRHSLFCILPPHVLESIATRGTPEQRAAAAATLTADATFRALRAAPITVERAARVAAVPGQKQRNVYTAGNGQTLPGTLVRAENGPPVSDETVNEAYDGLGDTYDFYADVFDRNSIDDEGLVLDATVHFGQNYNNAFWNSQQMVFGDGDGQLFNPFTRSLDVIGHELAHGVTEDEAGLIYFFQSGALNEHMSDVFGSLVEQKKLNQTANAANWLIGDGLFPPTVNGEALRSMKAPGTAYNDPILGKDPQPAHMKNFVNTYSDNGGVHINSGIPNHAFYLAATALGGYAWEKAGRIWYETLRDSRLRPNTGFTRFARLTVLVAERLYGRGSVEEGAVADAWQRVGLKVAGAGAAVT
jgi:Zn-dependent metalloprotease